MSLEKIGALALLLLFFGLGVWLMFFTRPYQKAVAKAQDEVGMTWAAKNQRSWLMTLGYKFCGLLFAGVSGYFLFCMGRNLLTEVGLLAIG